MTAFGRRLAAALEAGRATRKARAAGDSPMETTLLNAPPLSTRRMILALMQGQSLEEVLAGLSGLRKVAAEQDLGIVIVTDRKDIALFQQPDCITEYLPSSEQLAADSQQHDLHNYIQQRYAILLRKWEPLQVVPFGDKAMAIFASLGKFGAHGTQRAQ